jgi:hypothetical protein
MMPVAVAVPHGSKSEVNRILHTYFMDGLAPDWRAWCWPRAGRSAKQGTRRVRRM